ncbi:MAG: NUDIX hydrolase [Shimia sp.]
MDTPIKDAATVILLRDAHTRPRILMGQRQKGAIFMPSKFVFPGGAVDPGDYAIPLTVQEPCATRLGEASPPIGPALAAAAIRELWEETGLILGHRAAWSDAPPDWMGFAKCGYRPDAGALTFYFRALTPPGRPRRFDARFFLVDAGALATDPDDLSGASGELSHLQWVPLDEARSFEMPFITEVVLAEVARTGLSRPNAVPYFRNGDEESLFLRLGGRAL